ncbi:hypothetical protein L9F63_015307, partial [Diploptera punctata]
ICINHSIRTPVLTPKAYFIAWSLKPVVGTHLRLHPTNNSLNSLVPPENAFYCLMRSNIRPFNKSIHAIIIFETFAALSKMSDLEDFDHVFAIAH